MKLSELAKQLVLAREKSRRSAKELEATLERVHSLAETNPMLGTRGVRLGVLRPEVYDMQVRALVRAGLAVSEPPRVEIMIRWSHTRRSSS